jgi:glycosyltransferase involved in cell wall biosynthesis
MRILIITDGIWPYVLGGMQKHSFYLCKYFAQNSVSIHLVHFNQSNYDIKQLEFFTNEEKQYITHTIIDFPKTDSLPGHYLRSSFKYSELVFREFKNSFHEYNFIYSKGFTGWHLIREKKKGTKLPPIGVNLHGYEMFQKAPDIKTKLQHVFLLKNPAKYISKNADVVFSYGGKITKLIQSIGVNSSRIIELPSGIEQRMIADTIQKNNRPLKFVFLGRYERRKGIEEINSAIAQLKEASFEFHFIGPIPDEKKIQAAHIHYHGEVRAKDKLQSMLRNYDVLVCPSWSEGMPNVILEAMSQGLAVIATDVGATNALVNTHTGWLLHSSDSELLKSTIRRVSNLSEDVIFFHKSHAKKLVSQHFVWEDLITTLIEQIKKHI